MTTKSRLAVANTEHRELKNHADAAPVKLAVFTFAGLAISSAFGVPFIGLGISLTIGLINYFVCQSQLKNIVEYRQTLER